MSRLDRFRAKAHGALGKEAVDVEASKPYVDVPESAFMKRQLDCLKKCPPTDKVTSWLELNKLNNLKTGSTSIVLFGTQWVEKTAVCEVVAKVTFPSRTNNESCVAESQIVAHEFNNMIQLYWCPHVVRCVAAQTMTRAELFSHKSKKARKLGKEFDAILVQYLEKKPSLYTSHALDASWNVLVMEKCHVALWNFLLNEFITHSLTLSDMYTILFQVVYTLECFQRLRISHNDLHTGNVGIIELDAPEPLCYAVPSLEEGGKVTYVQLQTTYVVKVFDMDRAIDADPRVLYDATGFRMDDEGSSESAFCNTDLPFFLKRFVDVLILPECTWEHKDAMQEMILTFVHTSENNRYVLKNERSTPLKCLQWLLNEKMHTSVVPQPTVRPFVLPLQHILVDGNVSRDRLDADEYPRVACEPSYDRTQPLVLGSWSMAVRWPAWDKIRDVPRTHTHEDNLYNSIVVPREESESESILKRVRMSYMLYYACERLLCPTFYRLSRRLRDEWRKECARFHSLTLLDCQRAEVGVWEFCKNTILVPRTHMQVGSVQNLPLEKVVFGIQPTPVLDLYSYEVCAARNQAYEKVMADSALSSSLTYADAIIEAFNTQMATRSLPFLTSEQEDCEHYAALHFSHSSFFSTLVPGTIDWDTIPYDKWFLFCVQLVMNEPLPSTETDILSTFNEMSSDRTWERLQVPHVAHVFRLCNRAFLYTLGDSETNEAEDARMGPDYALYMAHVRTRITNIVDVTCSNDNGLQDEGVACAKQEDDDDSEEEEDDVMEEGGDEKEDMMEEDKDGEEQGHSEAQGGGKNEENVDALLATLQNVSESAPRSDLLQLIKQAADVIQSMQTSQTSKWKQRKRRLEASSSEGRELRSPPTPLAK
jgi:hypothetical protein